MAESIKPWIPDSHDDYDRLVGKEVHTRDGKKIGTIKEVYHPDRDLPLVSGDHAFLIETGRLRKWFDDLDEVFVPETAIAGVGDNRVVLDFTEDDVKQQGWTGDVPVVAVAAATRRI